MFALKSSEENKHESVVKAARTTGTIRCSHGLSAHIRVNDTMSLCMSLSTLVIESIVIFGIGNMNSTAQRSDSME